MSLLDPIASQLYGALKGKLYAGTLKRNEGSTLNEWGDVVPLWASYTFEGFTDDYEEERRGAAGIPAGDREVLFFSASATVTPEVDDVLNINAQWLKVRSLNTDPAKAVYSLQCFEISGDPE